MGLGVSHGASPRSGIDAGRKNHDQSADGRPAASSKKSDASQVERVPTDLQPGRGTYDLARLERAVAELVSNQDRLVAHIAVLEREATERDDQIAGLDRRLHEADALKAHARGHIDRLIDQLDALEVQIESAEGATVPAAE